MEALVDNLKFKKCSCFDMTAKFAFLNNCIYGHTTLLSN